MPRRTKTVTVTLEGRDKGKQFLLTEMPASQAEKWATKAFLAIAHANVQVPDEVQGLGMAGIAVVGLRALGGVAFAEAEPLLDEMMSCVKAIRDPKFPNLALPLIEDDIDDVMTRIFLRGEVFELHTGFSLAGVLSNSPTPEEPQPGENTSSSISTFRRLSGRS